MLNNKETNNYIWLERQAGSVNSNENATIEPSAIFVNGENIYIGCARIGKDVKISASDSGKIIIEDNVAVENNVELHAGDNEQIIIGEGTRLIQGPDTRITGQVTIGKNCEISGFIKHSILGDNSNLYYRPIIKWAKIGAGVLINGSVIKGYAPEPKEESDESFESSENYVIIENNAIINKATISTTQDRISWAFIENTSNPEYSGESNSQAIVTLSKYRVASHYSLIGEAATIMQGATLINTQIGANTEVQPNAYLTHSVVKENAKILRNAIITKSRLGKLSQVGCEVSKSWLSAGVTAVHGNSYVSAIIPEEYVIVNEKNLFEVINCPNLTNISAGVIFANSSGTPTADLSSTNKGTAFVWSTFLGVNANVINLYDHPDILLQNIFREEHITIICPFCLTKGEVWGFIPPFTYADALSSTSHKIGWVLKNYAGQIIEDRRRMKILFGNRPDIIKESDRLIEGTIRLGIRLIRPLKQVSQKRINTISAKLTQFERQYRVSDKRLKSKIEHLKIERSKWNRRLAAIEEGLKIYQQHLKSGVWQMKNGEFVNGDWYEFDDRWMNRALQTGRNKFVEGFQLNRGIEH